MLGLGEAVGMFGKGGSTAKLERLVKGQERLGSFCWLLSRLERRGLF
jgi:hypothetical protein